MFNGWHTLNTYSRTVQIFLGRKKNAVQYYYSGCSYQRDKFPVNFQSIDHISLGNTWSKQTSTFSPVIS